MMISKYFYIDVIFNEQTIDIHKETINEQSIFQ